MTSKIRHAYITAVCFVLERKNVKRNKVFCYVLIFFLPSGCPRPLGGLPGLSNLENWHRTKTRNWLKKVRKVFPTSFRCFSGAFCGSLKPNLRLWRSLYLSSSTCHCCAVQCSAVIVICSWSGATQGHEMTYQWTESNTLKAAHFHILFQWHVKVSRSFKRVYSLVQCSSLPLSIPTPVVLITSGWKTAMNPFAAQCLNHTEVVLLRRLSYVSKTC